MIDFIDIYDSINIFSIMTSNVKIYKITIIYTIMYLIVRSNCVHERFSDFATLRDAHCLFIHVHIFT